MLSELVLNPREFLFGLVSRSLFVPGVESEFGGLGLMKPGFLIDTIAKNGCSQKLGIMDLGVDVVVCWRPRRSFSDVLPWELWHWHLLLHAEHRRVHVRVHKLSILCELVVGVLRWKWGHDQLVGLREL